MKKLIVVLLVFLYSASASSQITSRWIISKDTLAYMWPSFLYFHNNYIPANIDGYTINELNGKKGDIVKIIESVTPNQALALALRIVGDEERYAVTKDIPYIIPHKFGIVMYLYSPERHRWELFNFETDHATLIIDFKKMILF